MAEINRATMPEEFYDITSTALLIQPEPQYLHCALIKAAMSASFDANAGDLLGFITERGFGNTGAAYLEDPAANRLAMADGLYDQVINVVPELGNAPGHTVRINRPAYEDTSYDQGSREIAASTTISVTPIAVGSEQTSITLKRFGGPFSTTQSAVAPIGVDRFDSTVQMHRAAGIAGLNLKRDFDKTVDFFGVQLLDNANTIIRPNGMVNDETPAVAGDYPFTFSLFASAERQLDDANIPYFGNGKRVMVLHPGQTEQLSNDSQFLRQARYDKNMAPMYKGTYWNSIGTWDLFKSNTLTTFTNGNSIDVKYAQCFGPGCIGVGMGDMPRVWNSTQDNYGQQALVVWLWSAGFTTLDSRFIARITTS